MLQCSPNAFLQYVYVYIMKFKFSVFLYNVIQTYHRANRLSLVCTICRSATLDRTHTSKPFVRCSKIVNQLPLSKQFPSN